MTKDSLGDRMKSYYEGISKTSLMRRTPVIIRIDGRAFHTFTRHFNKPYDYVLQSAMAETTKELCKRIQGCVFGYTQSDEITLVLQDYEKLNTEAWFGYEVQKMCSISASMATMLFNKYFKEFVNGFECSYQYSKAYPEKYSEEFKEQYSLDLNDTEKIEKLLETYKSVKGTAMFDARCFNIPKEEVCNCVIWRQQDATRNSIEMLGRYHYSPKQLYKKSCNDIQDMLMTEKAVNWNDIPTRFKRGAAVIQVPRTLENGEERKEWIIDDNMPILTQDRDYVEKRILI
jgi:tRNA(His) 5'-end guanylyltransferase